VGSIVPSISLTERPACAASEVSMYSIMASSSSSVRSLSGLLCWTLCSRGISMAITFSHTPGCSRRTFAMAFSPCREKSLSNAQIPASLSLLREPRSRPAGFRIFDFRAPSPPKSLSLTPGREAFHPMDAAGPDPALSPAIAQEQSHAAKGPETSVISRVLTGKERLGRKWMDEQRIDNCKVPDRQAGDQAAAGHLLRSA